MPNPVVHFEISGKDEKKLHDFYARLFDWHVSYDEKMSYATVETHDGGINGGIGPAHDAQRVTFYVQVPDLQAALTKAESLGGKMVMPPMEIPNVVALAQFTDPEGNLIGLVRG
jgi:predicted enzyme related to lactoylglutathione lyase